MPIYKKDQQLPVQPVIILLIGDPGTAKTSLSNTCKNVLNIDFDLGFKRSYGRPDSLQLERGWTEVIENLNNGEMDKYDTIVIDTAKGCLDDFLMVYVQEQDYKLRTNKLKAFGAIGEEFKTFINILRRKGKDIFIIAHSKTEGEGDTKRTIADITGQSNALLLRVADQVGFLSMRNNQRVVTFNPSDTSVGKNVAGLKDITLPLHTSPEWDGIADREIIKKVKDSLLSMSEEQRLALEVIENWRAEIDAIEAGETEATQKQIMDTYKEVLAIGQEHIKKQISAYFLAHIKGMNWKWDGKAKLFVPVTPIVAEVKTEATEQANEVADTVEAKPVEGERNPAGIINPNPNLAKPKEDLFAPTSN